MSLSWYSSINTIRLNNKTTKKSRGPTEIWTRIAGFKVQSANHYTMGPYDNNSVVICMNFSFKIFFVCVVFMRHHVHSQLNKYVNKGSKSKCKNYDLELFEILCNYFKNYESSFLIVHCLSLVWNEL